jgi:hypothetical protein
VPPLRKILLAVALVASIVATLFDQPRLDKVQPKDASRTPVSSAVPTPRLLAVALAKLSPPERYKSRAVDLFPPHSWLPVMAPMKLAAPSAPVLPFRYLGKVIQGDIVTAFLGQGERTHLLRKGDAVADYLVEEITLDDMTFVYVPLNEKQRLPFGSSQ